MVAYAVDLSVIHVCLFLPVIGLIAFLSFSFFLRFGAKTSTAAQGVEAIAGALGTLGIILFLAGIFVFVLALYAVYEGYFIYFEWKKGATPGKRVLGLTVITAAGGRLTFRQCLLRAVMRSVDVGLLLPGLISILVTEKKQRLGDLVAGTLVSHSPQEEDRQNYLYVKQADYRWFIAKCLPELPSRSDRDKFLSFAYPVFVLKTKAFFKINPDELSFWESFAYSRVPPLKHLNLALEQKLRLFAELCFQKTKIKIESDQENKNGGKV